MYLPYPEPLREDAGFVQASRDSIFLETLSFEMKVKSNRVDWFPPHSASNLHGNAWVNSTIAQQSGKNLVFLPQANQVDGMCILRQFIVVVWTAPSMRLNGPDLPSVHEYVPIHDSQGPRLVSMKQTYLRS
uniref:Uncharacterized protein n=1 Tax=Coccidioides posadasii RMSCC 3488 TaxID=454284 RepID=A0A0J6FKU8_COCPO|nr:hypothetical protein CPAG_06372 [Coccidioides posadasii RMSCC 3488]